MFLMLLISHPIAMQQQNTISSSIEDIDPEQYKFDATVQDMIGNDGNLNMLSPSQASAQHVGQDPQEEMNEQLDEKMLTIQEPASQVNEPNRAELVDKFDAVGTTEHTGGVEGSIDRLTMEIAASLKEQKTLVIWLFDASLSLKERRNAIADRFENVYKQLGQLEPNADKALKTAAAAFGEKLTILTDEPVDDIREVVPKVRAIKDDVSGKENTFSSVMTVANKFLPYRQKMRRNVMIIVVTDERGDDYVDVEKNVQLLRRYGMKVYCVGNAAVFGREKGFVSWTYEDGTTEDLPVDQGPETVAMERVELPFWGTNARDLDYMSAGYGPYALTRLCAETGGLYLVTAETKIQFDPLVMKNYRPDYRPIRDYEADLKKNQAKMALVAAANATRTKTIPSIQTIFRADNDNALRQEVTEAQKPMAELDYFIAEVMDSIAKGEKDRDKLETPRWRASYDLSMGRALALRVRSAGYNQLLAEMKVNPKAFATEGNNQWKLVPSKEITSGPAIKKLEKRAMEYLTRVIDENPGTPWALMAERELSTPLGWAWEESRADYAGMDRAAAERGVASGAREQPR